MPPRNPTKPSRKLTIFQQKWLAAYLVDPNSTRAYLKARAPQKVLYSTARTEGNRLLMNPNVQRELKAAGAAILRTGKMNSKKVVQGLSIVAKADPLDFYEFDENGNAFVKNIRDIPYRARLAISSIKSHLITRKIIPQTIDGEEVLVERSIQAVEIKLNDRVSALDKLAKIEGAYLEDNRQKYAPSAADIAALKERLKSRGIDLDTVTARSAN